MSQWAAGLDSAPLVIELIWLGGAAARAMQKPRGLIIHCLSREKARHRGQFQAVLTEAAQKSGGIALPLVMPDA